MTQSSDSNRLDRIEAIVEDLVESITELRDSQRHSETRTENLSESIAELRDNQRDLQQQQRHSDTRFQNVVESIAQLRDSQLEVQQEHLQVLRIVAQQQNEVVRINNEIAGLRTESLRILEHLFGSQQGG
ncbi:hypothetical protein [Argonema antarcticum]|uniref:hypothetical protein n=1 Tax=Argonema antarcticum TaxID=2942763 RepID=UPI002010EC77|nr:hypothetical protein [Argonema antarcticum]MCL1475625.1 hypothetical protein [Argonema antarcticum A004/B2]